MPLCILIQRSDLKGPFEIVLGWAHWGEQPLLNLSQDSTDQHQESFDLFARATVALLSPMSNLGAGAETALSPSLGAGEENFPKSKLGYEKCSESKLDGGKKYLQSHSGGSEKLP